MFTFSGMSIAARLAIALTVPTIFGLGLGLGLGFGLAVASVAHAGSRLRDADRIKVVMQFAPAIGNFVHQLQIERGLTNTMLQDPLAKKSVQVRQDQIVRADQAIEDLHRGLAEVPVITSTVAQIQKISAVIGSAIKQQDAATSEISSNTQLAARATQEVTTNIMVVDGRRK